jgi:hypothetical protein
MLNPATSSVCSVVGGKDCVALVTNCYMKINRFMTGSMYLQMVFSNIFSLQKALMMMEILLRSVSASALLFPIQISLI